MATAVVVGVGMDRIGARIRTARERAGLSQAAAAALVGVSQQSVAAWERGAQAIPAPVLVRLAESLGVSPASLLPGGEATDIAARLDVVAEVRALLDQLEARIRATDRPVGD